MRFATIALSLLATVSMAVATDGFGGDHEARDFGADIFPDFNRYNDWAICKGRVTKELFPTLQAPSRRGGCVRYFRGIDMTGVVTEFNFYFNDGFRSACDCIKKCLQNASTCTNWVWKHTFQPDKDSGKRSCTIYSSPNLPSGVNLAYDLAHSKGFEFLDPMNNPQNGTDAPLTFLDAANTKADRFGVSGFLVRDQNQRLYC